MKNLPKIIIEVLVKILAAILIIGATLYLTWLALAYLGMSVIISIDFMARSFNWIGINKPALGWLLLGCLVGGIIGLVKGLKRAGRKSDVPKVYGIAIALGCALLLAAYLVHK